MSGCFCDEWIVIARVQQVESLCFKFATFGGGGGEMGGGRGLMFGRGVRGCLGWRGGCGTGSGTTGDDDSVG